MTDYLVTDTELTDVADAIRTKGGTSAALEWPTDYVDAIDAIETGGGGGATHTVTCTGGKASCHSTSTTNPGNRSVPTYGTSATAQAGDIVCAKIGGALKDEASITPAVEKYWTVYDSGSSQITYFCFVMPDSDVTFYAK